ncbi:hypothetical protein FNJ84_20865, partial [Paracoccus sp. M683]
MTGQRAGRPAAFNDEFPLASRPFRAEDKFLIDRRSSCPVPEISSKRQAGKENQMANESMKLRVKTGEKDGKNFWDSCGVLFINR